MVALTYGRRRPARFVSSPVIGLLDLRTVFPAVEMSPRVIVAVRDSVLVAVLRGEKNVCDYRSLRTNATFYTQRIRHKRTATVIYLRAARLAYADT